jgi:ankyrin repeat protein
LWNNNVNFAFNWRGSPEEGRRNSVFVNNISYDGRNDFHPQARNNNNNWNTNLNINLTNTDFISLDDSEMSAPRNPDGSIPYSNFLRPSPDSAAIDAGIDVNMPYIGKAPDLGAFEYDPKGTSENYVKMLHQYVRDHDVAKIDELLVADTDINDKDWLGYAPLHWACYFGLADVVKLLMDSGANPNLVSDTGKTPTGIAKAMDYEQIAALLHKHGAKE